MLYAQAYAEHKAKLTQGYVTARKDIVSTEA
jgi:hypothetical protein